VAYDGTRTLTIYREPQQTQSADFQSTGALPADTLTRGLDKLTMLVQSISRKLGRCFRLNDKAGDVAALSEATRANTVFGFDSAGSPSLRDRPALLSLLSLSGSLQGAPTAYWADDGERVLKAPDFVGQLGLQLNTSTLYCANGTVAGSWAALNMTGMSGVLSAGNIPDSLVTYAKLQAIGASRRVLGRNGDGAGVAEEMTLSQLLDWVGPAAQGDILYRGASGWERLAAGTAGLPLVTKGAGASPAFEAAYASRTVAQVVADTDSADYATTIVTPPIDGTTPQISEGALITNLSVTITPKKAGSTLMVDCNLNVGTSSAGYVSAAVFRDSTPNAVCAAYNRINDYADSQSLSMQAVVPANATVSTTFTVRFGCPFGTTAYINRTGATVSVLGAAHLSMLKVTEIYP
jgi:hypothetical protein